MSASAIHLLIFATDEDSRSGSGSGEAGAFSGSDLPLSSFGVSLGICTAFGTLFRPPDASHMPKILTVASWNVRYRTFCMRVVHPHRSRHRVVVFLAPLGVEKVRILRAANRQFGFVRC